MGKGTFVDFKELKGRIRMVQILERYNLLSEMDQKGDRISGRCPIHKGEDDTQFRVSESKNLWNCFGCDGGGNILDFVSQYERVSIRKAGEMLAEWFPGEGGHPVRKSSRSRKVDEPKPNPESEIEERDQDPGRKGAENPPLDFELTSLDSSHEYLKRWGFYPDTISAFGLGYCTRGMLKGRVAIPFHNVDGELVAYAGRHIDKDCPVELRYKWPSRFEQSLEVFNIHRIVDAETNQPLLVTADLMDCIRLTQVGLSRVVALPTHSVSDRQKYHIQKVLGHERKITFVEVDWGADMVPPELLMGLMDCGYVRKESFPDLTSMPADELVYMLSS